MAFEHVSGVVDELGVLGGLSEELVDGGYEPDSVRADESGDVAVDAVELVVLAEVVLGVEGERDESGAESDDLLVDRDDGVIKEDGVGFFNKEESSIINLVLNRHCRIKDDLVDLALAEKLLELVELGLVSGLEGL